ncbi:MAG: dnaJ [Cytophagaceae bacterium]|jgi:curved DNA-binding protein CbpA|nr:dnaJ [Cytophagaceae bacterium]
MEFNHYQVLGVPRNASLDSIKKAYKTLAKKYHPDVNPGSKFYEDHFKKVNAAYAILSDPVKRQQYDVKLYHTEHPPVHRPAQARPTAQQRPRRSAPVQPQASFSIKLGMPSRQTFIVVGVAVLFIAGCYTLFNVMNRRASNNNYELGLESEKSKDYAGAMYYYQQGIEIDKSNYKIHERLANVLIEARPEYKESYAQAAHLYARALNHSEANKDTLLYKLSQCYIQLQEYDRALVALEEIKPNFNDTLLLLKGECYTQNKQWDNAIEVYNRFLDKHPVSDLAFQKAGYVYYKNVDYEKAKEYLNESIIINASNGISHYIRGLVNIANADTAEACQDFHAAYQFDQGKAARALYKYCQTH